MALVLLAAVGDSYNFHLSLKTLIPVSVRVDRCLLEKKYVFSTERASSGSRFVRCNVCDIIIILCFLQDDLVQCFMDCEDRDNWGSGSELR